MRLYPQLASPAIYAIAKRMTKFSSYVHIYKLYDTKGSRKVQRADRA